MSKLLRNVTRMVSARSKHTCTLIPGDGIGPEISAAVAKIFDAAGAPIDWEERDVYAIQEPDGSWVLPEPARESINKNKVGLKGPLATPIGAGHPSMNLMLRKTFGLYANVRPCKVGPLFIPLYNFSSPSLATRPNTMTSTSSPSEKTLKVSTPASSTRSSQASSSPSSSSLRPPPETSASTLSSTLDRTVGTESPASTRYFKLLLILSLLLFQANIMRKADGTFLRVAREIAEQYPDIKFEDAYLDTVCLRVRIT